MTKYYVYSVKNNDDDVYTNAFVEDPFMFAIEVFNPEIMEFSGVLIEADTPEEANRIYQHPRSEDVLVSCEEPRPTVVKRIMHNAKAQDSRSLKTSTLVIDIATTFIDLSFKISELARLINRIPGQSTEDVYKLLMEKYGQQLAELKYRPSKNRK